MVTNFHYTAVRDNVRIKGSIRLDVKTFTYTVVGVASFGTFSSNPFYLSFASLDEFFALFIGLGYSVKVF